MERKNITLPTPIEKQPIQVSDWEVAVGEFLRSLDRKQTTRALYGRTLRLFFEWVQTTGRNISELTGADIIEYKETLLARKLSPLSVSSYLTSISKFYAWTESRKVYPNIANGVHSPKRGKAFMKQHLSEDKVRELLSHFECNIRDFAIVNLLLRTGLRTVELVRADVGDIVFKGDRRVLLVWGKGRDAKDSFVVLSKKAWEPIRRYLDTRHALPGEPLFTSSSHRNTGGRLTTRTVSYICKEGMKAIGLDDRAFTAHSLRHTTAVSILRHGGSLDAAQLVLRHSDPATTQVYVESFKEEFRLKNAPELLIDSAF